MIDWARVSELKEEFGEDGFDEVLAIFTEETGPIIDRLATGRSHDPAADLHFVKGSADNMGMSQLTEMCRRGEEEIAAGTPQVLADIRSAYDGALVEISRPAA